MSEHTFTRGQRVEGTAQFREQFPTMPTAGTVVGYGRRVRSSGTAATRD